MKLHTLKPQAGSRHRRKRLGCGEASGHGKTSGKGHKGQKARSGGSIREGFEGGQMPLHRRLPKRGFNNIAFGTDYHVVNLSALEERFADGDEVTCESLREKGLVTRRGRVKVLGDGEISRKLTVKVDKVSATAKSKIEAAGGTVETA